MTGVLVTGAAGFIGSRLVASYLGRDGYRVYALLRGRSRADAEQRMRDALDFWTVPADRRRDRLVVLRGDIRAAGLGVEEALLATVRDQVALVVHAAAPLRLDQALEQARAAIVTATGHALDLFASFREPRRFGFVSTLEVAGDSRDVVREEFLDRADRRFLNSYEVAKFECEERLAEHVRRGTPITVFRPGMVVGEAATGRALRFQTFYLILERMLLEPLAPVMPTGCPLDTVPVDVVTDGIAALMEHPPAAGRVFHLTQGTADAVDFDAFLDLAAGLAEGRLGHRPRPPLMVPPAVVRAPLAVARRLSSGRLRSRLDALAVFLAYFGRGWRFDTDRTRAALAELGVGWPRFTEYLPNLVDYYLSHRGRARLPI